MFSMPAFFMEHKLSGLWPGGSAGSFSTSAGAIDILNIYYDGSSYYYQLSTG